MAKLSEEKIQQIIEAYSIIGTYSGTAKKLGVSPASVKKYVELGNKSVKKKEPKKEKILFSGEILSLSQVKIPEKDKRGEWLCLTEKELAEISELRKEI